MDILSFVNKWIHLLSIIGVVGGIMFALLVLRPGTKHMEPDAARPLWKSFGISVGVLWVLVLITGFINYFLMMGKVTGAYHMFAGMKMILAMVMFFLTLMMAHSGGTPEAKPKNRTPFLALILLLGIVVVGLSAHLNMGRMSGEFKKASTPVTITGGSN